MAVTLVSRRSTWRSDPAGALIAARRGRGYLPERWRERWGVFRLCGGWRAWHCRGEIRLQIRSVPCPNRPRSPSPPGLPTAGPAREQGRPDGSDQIARKSRP